MKNQIIVADAIEGLTQIESETVKMCVTSPPYFGLRDYGIAGQIGLEETPEEFIQKLVDVFREVKRVLTQDGTLWVNIGDSYAGGAGRWGKEKGLSTEQATNHGSFGQIGAAKRWKHESIKQKDLIGIPWLLAFALRADGWYLRQDIIWHKLNPMPESVTDRCTKSHEYIFLLSKSPRYYFDNGAIKEHAFVGKDMGFLRGKSIDVNSDDCIAWHSESIKKRKDVGVDSHTAGDGMKNKRDVWSTPTSSYKEAHFAVFPPELITPCILAGSRKGDIVLDCFMGSGTTAVTAMQNERDYLGVELNPEYAAIAERRISQTTVQMKLF